MLRRKNELLRPLAEKSTTSMMKMCWEIGEKFSILEKDLAEFVEEMAVMRKENAKLREENARMGKENEKLTEEIGRKSGKFEPKIAALNRELARLKGENRILKWQRRNASTGNTVLISLYS